LKILVVIPSLRRGGAERVVSLLTQEWAKSHQVLLAVYDGSSPAYDFGGQLIDLHLPAKGGALKKAFNAACRIFRLNRLVKVEQPDRVISFMESANFPSIISLALARSLDRLVVSVHNDPARFPRAHLFLMPIMYRWPRKVVAVSSGVKDALCILGVPKSKLVAIPNPAPPKGIGGSDLLTGRYPDRFILGVGRLHPQKGFDRLLKAFAEINDLSLKLVILGEGKERSALVEQAHSLGIGDRVSLPGAVEDVMDWYKHALCFVLSSRHEGWGNVLVEAMSNSCPVVSYDCSYGPSEIIQDGISGLLIGEGDVSGLADGIRRVISDGALRNNLVRNGLDRVQEFEVERLAEHWIL